MVTVPWFMWVVWVIAFTWPAFILPLIIGPIILIKFRNDNLSKFAALLTLKPVIATLLWALVLGLIQGSASALYLLTLLPGILLTLALIWGFRNLFKSPTLSLFLLLALDAIRWINTFGMFAPWWEISLWHRGLDSVWYPAALILPNIYAVVALVVGVLRAKQRELPKRVLVL